MSYANDLMIADAVNKVSQKVLGGGAKLRGPNALFDFVYQVWLEKALTMARNLPALFESERKNYEQQKKLLEEIGHKGKFTDTYGWSKNGELLHSFTISPILYHFFTNVIGPFLGLDRDFWSNENSKVWKRIKKMIIDGDTIRIHKFSKDIERKLMKEAGKSIKVAVNGTHTETTV